MKRVIIWDMDWYEKNSFIPKPDAMKVGSFHKQLGDLVYFVNTADDLLFDYDLIYVFREKKNTKFPPLKILDSPKSKLYGEEFIYYDGYWEPDAAIAMTRPSYDLYPLSDQNIYKGAHIVQLLYGTTFLRTKQDFTNFIEQPRKKTLVVDKQLWEASEETICECLDELKKLKNIEFKHPISIKKILSSEEIRKKFIELHFIGGTNMPFKNDYGNEFSEAIEIIDFLNEFSESHRVKLRPIKFDTVIYNHWEDKNNGIKDLERCLQIVDYGKKKKVYIELMSPKKRLDTPYWAFFEVLETWTKYNQYTSYVQAMLSSTAKRVEKTWNEILNDSSKWITPRVWFLLHVWTKYPHIIYKYGASIWGDNKIDLSLVDMESILKSVNKFDREDVLEKIQKEITGGEW